MTRMTAHKRKEWYIVAKNKRLTNKEKQARAELKKRMQDKGVLPPDKPKLNRKTPSAARSAARIIRPARFFVQPAGNL